MLIFFLFFFFLFSLSLSLVCYISNMYGAENDKNIALANCDAFRKQLPAPPAPPLLFFFFSNFSLKIAKFTDIKNAALLQICPPPSSLKYKAKGVKLIKLVNKKVLAQNVASCISY